MVRKREIATGIFIAIVTFVVLGMIAEGVLRSRAGSARNALEIGSDDGSLCTVPASVPGLIYSYAPGRCGNNSRGFPDVEHPEHKIADVFRIVLIGDSVAEGRDVERSERFAAVLQERLNALGHRVIYEVVVLARVGYSTSQELVLLGSEAMRLDPDLILWSYCLNDPAHPVYHNANGNLGAYHYRTSSYLFEWIRRAGFTVRERWRGRNCPGEFHERVHCIYDHRIQGEIKQIGAVTRANGIPVVFLIHPVFEEGKDLDDYSHAALHQRLAATATDSGLSVLDLRPALAGYPIDDIKIHSTEYFDPWHFNALGHRVTGETIAAFMAGENLLWRSPQE
jgi:lysophospholipase L1-like esterase